MMPTIKIDYKGECPACGHKGFHLIDEFENTQWIGCDYCFEQITTENGEIVEE